MEELIRIRWVGLLPPTTFSTASENQHLGPSPQNPPNDCHWACTRKGAPPNLRGIGQVSHEVMRHFHQGGGKGLVQQTGRSGRELAPGSIMETPDEDRISSPSGYIHWYFICRLGKPD
jgi:hypothetical protein